MERPLLLMELSVAVSFVAVDTAEDDGVSLQGKVSKYKLTERGLQTIETMLED